MWKTGVAIPAFNVTEPVPPLLLNKQRKLFKLFQNDVGLLAYQYSNGIQMEILKGNVNVNYGAVYENFVAQELISKGYPTYYFNNKKLGELDNVMGVPNYNIKQAIVLCNENLTEEGRVLNMPIYMIMFFKKSESSIGQFTIDVHPSALINQK